MPTEGFCNQASNTVYLALEKIQDQSEDFANSIYTAANSGSTDVALPGKNGTGANGRLEVDISTAAGAMAVSLWLEEKANTVQSASEVAAEQKKETSKVNQTVG